MQHFDLGAVPIYLLNYLNLNASSYNKLLQTAKTIDRDNRYSKSQYSSLTQVMSSYREPSDWQVLGKIQGGHTKQASPCFHEAYNLSSFFPLL